MSHGKSIRRSETKVHHQVCRARLRACKRHRCIQREVYKELSCKANSGSCWCFSEEFKLSKHPSAAFEVAMNSLVINIWLNNGDTHQLSNCNLLFPFRTDLRVSSCNLSFFFFLVCNSFGGAQLHRFYSKTE